MLTRAREVNAKLQTLLAEHGSDADRSESRVQVLETELRAAYFEKKKSAAKR